MDNELREKLEGIDWPSVLTELYAYAYAKKNYAGLRHSASPEDLVNDAVSKVLSGERQWDYERHPDITIYLKSVIKSLASHAWETEKAAGRRDKAIKKELDCETPLAEMDRLETESYHKSLLDEIESDLKDDEELLLIFYAMKEGHLKDQELAEELSIEIAVVRNAKKRMRRKLTDVKQRLGKL